MYYTYIIISESTGKFYIGQTNNIQARLSRHNSSKNFSTKNRGPWKLIFTKEFPTRAEAMKYEKYLKSLKNKEYILKKICGYETA
jgi:putative endonuclease